jgi:hypothetical protein
MKEQKANPKAEQSISGSHVKNPDRNQLYPDAVEIDTLVDELVHIGQTSDFVSDPGGAFDHNGCHKRAREIGMHVNKMGGAHVMQAVWYRVTAVLGPERGRSLEIAWGFIGDWWP